MTPASGRLGLDSEIESFVKTAVDLFLAGPRAEAAPYVAAPYVKVPARVLQDRLEPEEEPDATEPAARATLDPLQFLAGLPAAATDPHLPLDRAPAPSLCLIAGEYGTGKTELVRRVTELLRDRSGEGAPWPLPVALVRCRRRLGLLGESAPEARFHELLYGGIFEQWASAQPPVAAAGELLTAIAGAIRDGRIFLLLDGLDELIFEPSQHERFFRGLAGMLRGEPGDRLAVRVAVSVRTEYLRSFEGNRPTHIADLVHHALAPQAGVYYLQLDVFDDSRLRRYLRRRTAHASAIFAALTGDRHRLGPLRRPLLVKLWCDSAPLEEIAASGRIAPGDLTEAKVFGEYILDASRKMRLETPALHTWDLGKMAVKSVELYREGRSYFRLDELGELLEPRELDPSLRPDAADDPEEAVLQSIHKCPFLIQRRDRGVEFSHRSFLEYFTARGVAKALGQEPPDPGPFNELVLNVDMRKFLRDLVGEERFCHYARLAWGLGDEAGGWELEAPALRPRLEEIHGRLLAAMTEPGSLGEKDLEQAIELLKEPGIDPRYLTYAYEAVSIHLRHHRWRSAYRPLRDRFSSLLHQRLEQLLDSLDGPLPATAVKDRLLLVDRVLDIGASFGFGWMAGYLGEERIQRLAERTPERTEDEALIGRINQRLETYRELWQ